MLDLFLFVLGTTLSGGGGDTAQMPSGGEAVAMTQSAEDAVPLVVEDSAVTDETTAEPEGGTWNTTGSSDGSSDGSWISNRSDTADSATADTSWISNKSTSSATSGTTTINETSVTIGAGSVIIDGEVSGSGKSLSEDESTGNSLLAGVVESDPAPSLGAEETFTAEPQIPSGKFTTAAEVKPILEATKGNWVAVREYDGKDFLYVTHLWAWRCGLLQMRYAVNGGDMQVWPLPPCHENTNAPNAIIETDGLPYGTFALGSIQSIQVELLLDDLSEASSAYVRTDVLMP
ncbi:MAG: hypothetical protein P1U83_06095 [Roseovarius sp.]|nr:hypothetical protein [Roseovarius sp.]